MNDYPPEIQSFAQSIFEFLQNAPHSRRDPGIHHSTGKWYLDYVLEVFSNIPTRTLSSLIEVLSADGYVEVQNGTIDLTPKSRKYLLFRSYAPLPDASDYVMGKDGFFTPSYILTTDDLDSFQNHMSNDKSDMLVQFLEQQRYVNDPKQFVSFLRGLSSGTGIELSSDKLTEVCVLLDLLYRDNNIRLKGKKGYQKFIEQNILPFCSDKGTEQTEQFKAALRKRSNKKWLQSGADTVITTFMAKLNPKQISLILYCLSCLN